MKITITESNHITCSKVCSITEETYSVTVPLDKYNAWKNQRLLIQNVFPELDEDQREFLMSGITPLEWNEFFTEQEIV